jgi:hypothetical protein
VSEEAAKEKSLACDFPSPLIVLAQARKRSAILDSKSTHMVTVTTESFIWFFSF